MSESLASFCNHVYVGSNPTGAIPTAFATVVGTFTLAELVASAQPAGTPVTGMINLPGLISGSLSPVATNTKIKDSEQCSDTEEYIAGRRQPVEFSLKFKNTAANFAMLWALCPGDGGCGKRGVYLLEYQGPDCAGVPAYKLRQRGYFQLQTLEMPDDDRMTLDAQFIGTGKPILVLPATVGAGPGNVLAAAP